jgi:N-acetylated-alpha-linked acidic dipeptidase
VSSDSDHTVFLNHLGRPTVGLEFDGQYGVYHSGYDDHYGMTHFGRPGFQYHIVISRLWGLLALRLANAEVLPYDFEAYAGNIHDFLSELDGRS